MSPNHSQLDGQSPDEPAEHRPTKVNETGPFVPDVGDGGVDPWGTKLANTISGSAVDRPASFGRYKVTGTLGQGGFGVVYRGYDPDLRRDVAIKIPRPERVAWVADAEAYLTEARLVARLDHPGIVPIHDVGRTDDGVCYTVSKYIAGGDLSHWIARDRPHDEAAELVAQIAESLHYAHQHGLVHRDIKPGNILLDEVGHPVVVDFGLALADEASDSGSTSCGTPAYMSPEQARGEGHRVDARSDIYSLGVVFYELLTGRRPYRQSDLHTLIDEITSSEIRPPRQLDDKIPKELERICLKALAKRSVDRYTTALDLADDLRHWQAKRKARRAERRATTSETTIANPQPQAPSTAPAVPKPPSDSAPQPAPLAKVVPKGLRSFDAHDAEFFLQLLPGPTDRDGLPESIRFWKTRLEESDADATFSVGLIYGPSGCGKSSLIKAGLLPRLARHILPVYLEATSDDTEARLFKGLRKLCPDLPPPVDLVELLASLRRGHGLAAGQKVMIVLDQFEQWLHVHRDSHAAELVRALRHCDGAHVQCVVMVRDDFWMAASRFMDVLEIPLIQGQNSAAADLFGTRHAHRVLTLFGRAFGCLPEGELSAEAEHFLDQSVAGLAEDETVISVRLALFAEMVKSKPWAPATLVEIGGITGVGATFLEETFSASTAPPRHRLHQPAARAVLKALLPDAGADIRGHRKRSDELLAASGYERRPAEFVELLRILDAELRLITPADEENAEQGTDDIDRDEASDETISSAPRSYQLTHDYLVPSLRDWLTHKQRETRRGRAELRLAERAATWNAKPDARFLPC